MSKHKNISRIDTGNTHGWQVRFKRQGRMHSRFFADKKWGGREQALALALQWRDEKRLKLPVPADPHEARGKRSETGVRGLAVGYQDVGNGTKKPYVQISYQGEDGRRRSSSFSVEKWGWRRAIWKACRRLGTWRGWSAGEMQHQYATAHRRIDRTKYGHPNGHPNEA